jgi:hypothetical protein
MPCNFSVVVWYDNNLEPLWISIHYDEKHTSIRKWTCEIYGQPRPWFTGILPGGVTVPARGFSGWLDQIRSFTVLRPALEFFIYMETSPLPVTGLQNLGLCSALTAFEQGWIFIVPHLLWHRTSVFSVSSEGPPHSVASYNTRGGVEDLF